MRVAKFIDIIKSYGDHLRIDNLAGYKDDYEFDDLGDNDLITKKIFSENVPSLSQPPLIYNLPAGSATPILINFVDSTIKFGGASEVPIGTLLTAFKANPTIKFKQVIDTENTKPIGNEGWITNEEWADNTYTSLVELTLQPDTDTAAPGGLTLDNINIIIKA